MPGEIDEGLKGQMVAMRALDYDKKQIAEELDVAPRTVSRHLSEIREEAEQEGDEVAKVVEMVLAGAVGASLGVGIGLGLKAFVDAISEAQQTQLENKHQSDDQKEQVSLHE